MTPTTGTAVESNTQLALRWLSAMDQHDFDTTAELMSPDFHLHFSGQQLNRDVTMTLIRSVYESFGDFRHEVQETFAVDDRVILRIIDRGTHTGVFEGVPATGRQINIGQISIIRVANGKVVEVREEADMLGLMQQLGAIPPQTA